MLMKKETKLIANMIMYQQLGKMIINALPKSKKDENETKFDMSDYDFLYKFYLKHFAETDVKGEVDKERLGDILVECYDEKCLLTEAPQIIVDELNTDYESANKVVNVLHKKAYIFTKWKISKSCGATYFTIDSLDNDKYEGKEFPVDDFYKYIEFFIENNALPVFKN